MALAAVSASVVCIDAQVVEIDGLWYDVAGDQAKIVKNPDGSEYTGKVTIPDSVTLSDGTRKQVYEVTSAFQYSSVEEVIFDLPLYQLNPNTGRYSSGFFSFRSDKDLNRIQFNYFAKHELMKYGYNNINVGNYPGCVYCYMRETEAENLLIVDKFNLYDSDGKQLKPRLMVEQEERTVIYPDENNIFHLDKEWKYNGEYCQVLPLGTGYYVVILYGENEDGEFISVRAEPDFGQSGLETTDNGLIYSINYNGATLKGYDETYAFPADIMIPETVNYEGNDYTVISVGYNSLEGFDVESVEFPATVIDAKYSIFNNCNNLERVDFSKTGVTEFFNTFVSCPVLCEVVLPEACMSVRSMFSDCPELKNIVLPVGCNCTNVSYRSGLVETTAEWIDSDHVSVTITNFGITFTDGTVPEYYPYKGWQYSGAWDYENNRYEYFAVVYTGEKQGDSYIFNKSDFYDPNPAVENPRFNGSLRIGAVSDVSQSSFRESYYSQISVPDPDTEGVNDIECEVVDAPVNFYNLQGIEVDSLNLAPGIYIRRQGNSASKILVK